MSEMNLAKHETITFTKRSKKLPGYGGNIQLCWASIAKITQPPHRFFGLSRQPADSTLCLGSHIA